jgi:hypothetical protein
LVDSCVRAAATRFQPRRGDAELMIGVGTQRSTGRRDWQEGRGITP